MLGVMNTTPIRIAIVDDHEILREGLRAVFDNVAEFEVVAEAAEGEQALRLCRQVRPDVVVVDVRMPGMPVCALIGALRSLPIPARVLVFTSYASDAKIVELIEAGATGFVLKDGDRIELLSAMRAVANGQTWLHPTAQSALTARAQQQQSVDTLTPREHAVLMLIAQGRSNKAIAGACQLTEGTVKGYVSQIIHKLGVCDRTGAAMHAVRRGWVDLRAAQTAGSLSRQQQV